MITYTVCVEPMGLIVRHGKMKKARKFMQADGLEIYVVGALGKRRDAAINLALNKAIECGFKAYNVRWW